MTQKENITIREALNLTESALIEAATEEAGVEAEWILAEVLGMKRFELFLHPDQRLGLEEQRRLHEIIERRRRREPLAYITGFTDFRGFIIKVSEAVLIPRPETELLVEEALSVLKEGNGPQRVLETCTGSGCISVALASEFERVSIVAIDISAEALVLARENARCNKVADKINFLRGDLLLPVKKDKAFDLIVANPPYITDLNMEALAPEIRLYEPELALCGGSDGMDYITRLIHDSARLLRPGGSLLLEIGLGQAADAAKSAEASSRFEDIQTKKDLSGIERIFMARKRRTP